MTEGGDVGPRFEIQRSPAVYMQIAASLRARIHAGVLADGARLPSVRALARELDISHGCAREALRQLCREGLAQGIPGKATVVRAPRAASEHEESAR